MCANVNCVHVFPWARPFFFYITRIEIKMWAYQATEKKVYVIASISYVMNGPRTQYVKTRSVYFASNTSGLARSAVTKMASLLWVGS